MSLAQPKTTSANNSECELPSTDSSQVPPKKRKYRTSKSRKAAQSAKVPDSEEHPLKDDSSAIGVSSLDFSGDGTRNSKSSSRMRKISAPLIQNVECTSVKKKARRSKQKVETVDKQTGALLNFRTKNCAKDMFYKRSGVVDRAPFAWMKFWTDDEKKQLALALRTLGTDADVEIVRKDFVPGRSVDEIADFLGLLKVKARKIAFSPDFDLGYGMSTVEISACKALLVRVDSKPDFAASMEARTYLKQAFLLATETPEFADEPIDEHTIDFDRVYRLIARSLDPSFTVENLRSECNKYDLGFLALLLRTNQETAENMVTAKLPLVETVSSRIAAIFSSIQPKLAGPPFVPDVPLESGGMLAHKVSCIPELNPLRMFPRDLFLNVVENDDMMRDDDRSTSDVSRNPVDNPEGLGSRPGCGQLSELDQRAESSRNSSPSEPPKPRWKTVYEAIERYRKDHLAPVDTMGCSELSDSTYPPSVQRYHALLGLMLSSQTRDEITAGAMRRLRARIPPLDPHQLLTIPVEELEQLLKPVGFYKKKAQYIRVATQKLIDDYECDIPDTVEGLMALPGVGPKMAYLCMQAAWQKDLGVGVDVHVHRISNRLGWVHTTAPEQTRKALEDWLPQDYWRPLNKLLVGFGQTVCRARDPQCVSLCPVSAYCPFYQSTKS